MSYLGFKISVNDDQFPDDQIDVTGNTADGVVCVSSKGEMVMGAEQCGLLIEALIAAHDILTGDA